jgi:hypothetical protein
MNTVTKIGFLVPNLNNSWSNILINSINSSIAPQVDISVFYENQIIPSAPLKFLSTNMVDAYNYPGQALIATGLSTAYKLLKFPSAAGKYYYIMEFEWMKIKNKQYEELAEIYQSSELKLITKNNHYKKVMEDCWKANIIGIVEDFNIKQFKEVIGI